MRHLWLLLALVVFCAPARADDLSVSHSDWMINGKDVRLSVLLPSIEARRVVDPVQPVTAEAVAKYVAAHVAVHSAAGDCAPIDQGYDIGKIDVLTAPANSYRFEVFFECPGASGIRLENTLLLDRAPAHIDFANIEIDGGKPFQKMFTRDRPTLSLADAAADGIVDTAPIGFYDFLRDWIGPGFLLALLLVLRSRRDWVLSGAALALGYLASALIAISGKIVPDPMIADAFNGLCLLLVAVEALVMRTKRGGGIGLGAFAGVAIIASVLLVRGNALSAVMLLGAGLLAASYAFLVQRQDGSEALRLVPVALFGFLNGLRLVPALMALNPGPGRFVLMLSGFDLGVLGAALLILFAAFVVMRALRFLDWRGPKILPELGTAAASGAGLFWLAAYFWR